MNYYKNLKSTWLFIFLLCCTVKSYSQSDSAEVAKKSASPTADEVKKKLANPAAEDLAKKLANPIADLISVPFQNNSYFGNGKLNGSQDILNFEPVIPIHLSKELNLITRWILPFVMQYNLTSEAQEQIGLSDATVSAFLSPSKVKNGITWGLGPAFLVPTGTDPFLSSRKFGIGPTGVVLKQSKGWTLGLLVNQIWSVAGEDELPPVSQMFFQPFITYNWKSGAGVGGTLEWTQNWETRTSVMWLTPFLNGITSVGKQKVQLEVGPQINIDAPRATAADFGWRAVITLLFPQEK